MWSAVFLDRDGVINVNRDDHVQCWEQFRFIPGALDALRRLRVASIPVVVVTNQANIGRGITPIQRIEEIHARLLRAAEWAGGPIVDVLYCPHRPEDRCSCRKPEPGLLIEAARRHHLDLTRCAIVGDAYSDIMAGIAVGCTPIMVKTGRGLRQHEAVPLRDRSRYRLADDLTHAVNVLLAEYSIPQARPPYDSVGSISTSI